MGGVDATSRSRWSCARTAAALLGLVAALAGCGPDPTPPAPPGPRYESDGSLRVAFDRPRRLPNLIVIVVDTLRADALEGPGGSPGRMPFLAGLGRKGTVLTQVSSSAPWTIPSLASLLTGDSPSRHGCRGEEGVPALPAGRTTFAEALARGHGYETAVAAGVAVPGGGGGSSLFAGFGTVIPGFVLQGTEPLLARWVEGRDRSRPFFLLLHTYEAHHPYGAANHPFPPLRLGTDGRGDDPIAALGSHPAAKDVAELVLTSQRAGMWVRTRHPELMASAVTGYFWDGFRDAPDPDLARRLKAAYDAGTTWVDGLLERTVERLRSWGLLEDTVLAVTADHGEAFGEHGTLEHGRVCYDEVVRVPLLLVGPGALGPGPDGRGRVVTANVSLMDLMPTLLEAAGQPLPTGVVGTSLVPVIEGREPGRIAEVQERLNHDVTREDLDWALRALRSDAWKAVFTWDRRAGTVKEEAYDLRTDPGERDDLAKGSGRLEGLALDPAFCREVERVRDELAREGATSPRPAPCGPK